MPRYPPENLYSATNLSKGFIGGKEGSEDLEIEGVEADE